MGRFLPPTPPIGPGLSEVCWILRLILVCRIFLKATSEIPGFRHDVLSETLTTLGLLSLRCLHVEGDTHRFGEGEIDRAALLPSLVKLLDIAFAVGRLHPDVEADVP